MIDDASLIQQRSQSRTINPVVDLNHKAITNEIIVPAYENAIARVVPKKHSGTLKGFLLDQGHLVRYNCKTLIRVLYPRIDLRQVPPLGMDMGKFITELAANLSPPREESIDASSSAASIRRSSREL